MTSNSRAQVAYYESEAALRLVDHEIHALRGGPQSVLGYAEMHLNDLPQLLDRANEQILFLIAHVRAARLANRDDIACAFLSDVESRLTDVAMLLDPAA